MKTSNIPNSLIAKYAHILTGVVFITTSVLPVASVLAQTGPTLTVAVETRTPKIPASSEVVYRVKVTNPTSSVAYNVKVTSDLPTGFTYAKHLTTLQKGAVKFGSTNAAKFTDRAYTTKPVAGQNTLVWDKITIPANGLIEFIFTATASPTPSTTAYSIRKLEASSYGSATSTVPNTKSFTNGTADDVTLKAIPPTPTLTLLPSVSSYDAPMCAEPGGEGVGVNLTGIVNTYFKPTMQTVAAESKTINIASQVNVNSLPTVHKGAAQNIQPGDLVLIVQMQDASINAENSTKYGSGNDLNQGSGQTNMGSSGLYEYAIASSTVSFANGGGTLTLKRPLINTYRNAEATPTSGQKRFQVIRVPQYASAKVLGTMFATPWDGNVGGILAVDAFGTFDLNGQRLSVNEAGFRGGFGLKNNNLPAQEGFVGKTNVYGANALGNVDVNPDNSPKSIVTQNTLGSGKGEGVAGTPRFISTNTLSNVDPIDKSPVWSGGFSDNKIEGYPGGDTGRGAPANAGGGANAHNAGGGGGGNGGNGGQGSTGYGYNSVLKDAGGRPGSLSLTHIPTPTRVFMGGGGGGGEANDSPQGVPGGSGGGIVMLRAGTIVDSGIPPGVIFANGANGDRGAFGANPDGGGGGGAGGTVLIQSRNPTSASIRIQANGGSGGNSERDSFYDYNLAADLTFSNGNGNNPDGYPYQTGRTPHGPGGGGAGGIVLYNVTSSATIIPAIAGGVSGLTDDPSPSTTLRNPGGLLLKDLALTTRNANGATAGSPGQVRPFTSSEDRFADLNAQTACSPANLEMVVSTSTPNAAPGDIVTYTMKVTNPATSGGATAVSLRNQLPTGFTYASTPANGIVLRGEPGSVAVRETDVNPVSGSTTPTWGKFSLPPGASVELTFRAQIGGSVPDGLYHDIAHSMYPNPRRLSDSDPEIKKSYGENPNETGGDITVKRTSVPMVWNVSPSVRIVRK